METEEIGSGVWQGLVYRLCYVDGDKAIYLYLNICPFLGLIVSRIKMEALVGFSPFLISSNFIKKDKN